MTLPKLYHAIGKRIVGSDKLPADLEHHRQKIRQLESGIAATPEEIKSDPAGGFAAKAKQFAQQAAQKATKATGDAAATVQIQAAYVALGKGAVEKYGDKLLPPEFLPSLSDAQSRFSDLSAQIDTLNASAGMGSLTAKRALFVGGGLVATICVLSFMPFRISGRNAPESSKTDVRREQTSTTPVSVERGSDSHDGGQRDKRRPDSTQQPAAREQATAPPRAAPEWFQEAEDRSVRNWWESAESLTPASAKAAVAKGTNLEFWQLTQLSPEIAGILSRSRHSLLFASVSEISPAVAEKLAAHVGGPSDLGSLDDDELSLSGLRSLPDAVAIALARRTSGVLTIGSPNTPIPTITPNAAKSLSKSHARALEIRVKNLAKDGQESLAGFGGSLSLPELTRIESDGLLKNLVSNGQAILGMETITPAQARILVDAGSPVDLPQVTRIDRETASVLSDVREELSLLGLKTCPEDARALLARNKKISLP